MLPSKADLPREAFWSFQHLSGSKMRLLLLSGSKMRHLRSAQKSCDGNACIQKIADTLPQPTSSHSAIQSFNPSRPSNLFIFTIPKNNNRSKAAMMTIPTTITSSSSSLYLGLLGPTHQMPAASSSSEIDISHSIIHGPTITPAQGMIDIAHNAQQEDTALNLAPKRMRRSRQVRFDSKISGRRIVSYNDEVRRDIYYNVSHL